MSKRRRRLGYATVTILRAIDEGHRYGLDIVEATGLASGTVYVALGRLQKRGFLRASWENQEIAERDGRPRRRYYDLTRDGSAALADALQAYAALAADPGAARESD